VPKSDRGDSNNDKSKSGEAKTECTKLQKLWGNKKVIQDEAARQAFT